MRLLYLIICLCFLHPCLGQGWESNLSVALRTQYGSFIANHPKLQYVQDGHTMLNELDIIRQTTGQKSWQQPSNYPQIGLAFLYGQSGASEYIGHIAAILPFMNFHLREGRGADINLRLAVGPAWVQKDFNTETNYENLVIGSHLNACFNGMITGAFHILPHLDFEMGLSFTHISNGSMKLPNLGLNIPSLTAGFRYDLYPQKRTSRTYPPFKKKYHYYLYSFVAGKQSYPLQSGVYLVNVFNAEVLRDFSRTCRLGGGINITIDRANSNEVPYSPTFAWDRGPSHLQAAIYGVYEYVVGNLSFPLQVGVYLYNNYLVNSIYQNIGIKYHFTPHWSAGFALKAHLGDGDFMQWGLGYRF